MKYTRYIQRHTKQTRFTHALLAITCIYLCISGLFVFVPALASMNAGVTQAFRISHRIVGCIFILGPIISAITAPEGFKEFLGKYIRPWTKEDKKWLMKFVPYMLGAKRTHMPDQDEVKSGQIVSDGALIILSILMAVTGLGLWLGTSVFQLPGGVLAVLKLLHDVGFILIAFFGIMHAHLGGGLFQPYRRMGKVMWGNGQISEADAMYHWGFWTREQIEKAGDNIILKDEDGNIVARGHDAVYGPLAPKPLTAEEAKAIVEGEQAAPADPQPAGQEA